MDSRAARLGDLGWSVCLGVGTVVYLWLWPRNLNFYDESILLYEARRIVEGDVPYRDFFEIVTPGAWYLMAGIFHLFGASIDTARATISVVHAISAIVIFLCGRTIGVARGLAAVPAIAYIALCYPNCDYVSPHWFATCLALLLLYSLLKGPAEGATRGRWLFLAGVFAGLTLAFQQQRGLALAVGVPFIIIADALLARWWGVSARLVRSLSAYVGGGLVVGVPALIYFVVVPGIAATYEALVAFPLFQYASYIRVPWGQSLQFPGIVLPWLFGYLPFLLPVAALTVVTARQPPSLCGVRQRLTLLLFAALSILTILHCPDYLHIALIAPIYFILAAAVVEWGIDWIPPMPAPWVRAGLVAALVMALVYQAGVNVGVARELFPMRHHTRFGWVDFSSESVVQFVDQLQRVIDAAPTEEIFVFPHYPGFYLITGARNATRFSLLLQGYSPPAHFQEIIRTLDAKRTRSIVFALSTELGSPFNVYLRNTYRRVGLPFGEYHLLQRKDMPPTSERLPAASRSSTWHWSRQDGAPTKMG